MLVVDLVGSTERLVALGDERGNRDQVGVLAAFSGAITDAGGRVVKDMGDGVLAVFDSVRHAVAAGVDLQRATDGLPPVGDRPAQARVGVSVGEVGLRGDDLVGLPVVEAARLCSMASAGQVLVSDVVLALGRLDVPTRPVGSLELKGLPEPIAVSEVLWEPLIARPPLPAGLVGTGLPFRGRAEPLTLLRQAWAAARAGAGGLALVSGEPGVGKTRLLATLAEEVHDDGTLVAYGRCDELSALTYQPFVEALRGLLVAEVLDPVPEGLRWLLPELASGGNGAGDSGRAQVELLDGVVAAVRGAARGQPLLLVLDDLHWASGSTLAVLLHLLGALDGVPVLVAGTYRDTDVDRRHPLGVALADMHRLDPVHVALTGLDDDEVEEVLRAAAGHELEEDGRQLARAVRQATGGNAFFIGELLASLVEQGAFEQSDERWRLAGDLADLGLPEGIRDVLGRRLSQLPDGADEVLAMAAVIGRAFDVRLLAEVGDRGIDEVLDAVSAAVTARLVIEDTDLPGCFAFAHALVRQVLLEELSLMKRARLHERVGDAVAARAGEDPVQLRSAALHLLEAAPFDTLPRALALVRRADEATVRPVPAETLAMVTAVRRAVDDSDVPPSEDLAMVFVEGAIAEFMSGNRDAVAHYAQRAVDVAREAGADAAFASAVAVGGQATGFGLDLQFLPLIPEALSLVDADAPQRLALMAQAHLAACFFADGTDPVTRTETLVTELEAAHGQGPVEGLSAGIQAMAWWMAPWGYLAVADLDRQTELVARAVQCATELDHGGPEHLAGAYAAFRRGDRAGVADHIVGLAEGDQSRDIPLYLAAGAQNEATLALFEGRLGDAPDLIDRVALAVPREPMFLAGVACQRAWLAYVGGRFGDVVAAGEEMAALFPFPRLVAATRGLFAQAAGDLSVRRFFDQAWLDGIETIGRDWCWVGTVHALGELAVALDDRERGAGVEEALQAFGGQFVLTGCMYVSGSVDATLGRLARLRGDDVEARRRFESALDLEERSGAVLFAEQTRRELSRDG